ncbi:MAG: alpha/beta fold hydrolase [Hyphomicrobiales bacterium]
MRLQFHTVAVAVTFLAGGSTSSAQPACQVGLYGNSERFTILTQSDGELHYSFDDGTVGEMGLTESRVGCDDGSVRIGGESWPRINIRQIDVVFEVDGVALSGRLIEPPHAGPETPLIVYAHGSERSGWLDSHRDPYQMVGRGVSVFIYDKRGTGASGGEYSQNVPRLAADLAAVAAEAKRLSEGRFGRFGLVGLSQGGWVVTYAAESAGADFIAVGYGLAVDILEEDAAEVELALCEAGYGPTEIALARRITDATALIATSATEEAVRALEPLRAEFAGQPWLAHVQGDFTGLLFNATTDEILTQIAPYFDSFQIDWSIDPVAVIAQVSVPQLWVLAGSDREAPVDITLDRLQSLQQAGEELTVMVFPQTDHGMWEFETLEDGTRRHTRITPGYYDLLVDWAHGKLAAGYGNAELR